MKDPPSPPERDPRLGLHDLAVELRHQFSAAFVQRYGSELAVDVADRPAEEWARLPCPAAHAQHPVYGHPLFRQSVGGLFAPMATPFGPSGTIGRAKFSGIVVVCCRTLDFSPADAESEARDVVFGLPNHIHYPFFYDWAVRTSQHWVAGADPFEHAMFLQLLFNLVSQSIAEESWAQALVNVPEPVPRPNNGPMPRAHPSSAEAVYLSDAGTDTSDLRRLMGKRRKAPEATEETSSGARTGALNQGASLQLHPLRFAPGGERVPTPGRIFKKPAWLPSNRAWKKPTPCPTDTEPEHDPQAKGSAGVRPRVPKSALMLDLPTSDSTPVARDPHAMTRVISTVLEPSAVPIPAAASTSGKREIRTQARVKSAPLAASRVAPDLAALPEWLPLNVRERRPGGMAYGPRPERRVQVVAAALAKPLIESKPTPEPFDAPVSVPFQVLDYEVPRLHSAAARRTPQTPTLLANASIHSPTRTVAVPIVVDAAAEGKAAAYALDSARSHASSMSARSSRRVSEAEDGTGDVETPLDRRDLIRFGTVVNAEQLSAALVPAFELQQRGVDRPPATATPTDLSSTQSPTPALQPGPLSSTSNSHAQKATGPESDAGQGSDADEELPAALVLNGPDPLVAPSSPTKLHFYVHKANDIGTLHIKPSVPGKEPPQRKKKDPAPYDPVYDRSRMCGTTHVPWSNRDQYSLECTLLQRLAKRVEERKCPRRFALMDYARTKLLSPEHLQGILDWNEGAYDPLVYAVTANHPSTPDPATERALTPGLPHHPTRAATAPGTRGAAASATSFAEMPPPLVPPEVDAEVPYQLPLAPHTVPPEQGIPFFDINYRAFQTALAQQAEADALYQTYSRIEGHRADTVEASAAPPPAQTKRPLKGSTTSPFICSTGAIDQVPKLGPSRLRHPDIPVEESVALKAQTRDILIRPKFGPRCKTNNVHLASDEVMRWLPGERPLSHSRARQRQALEQQMAEARQRAEQALDDMRTLPV